MVTTSATSASSGVSGAISGLATGGNKSSLNNVNFDTFLKLLVTQLKNQDPLNPLEGTEFTSQIAQFSSLEQQVNGNGYLKELLAQKDYGQQALGASYLDKMVLGQGNLLVKDGDTEAFGYTVAAGARNVEIEIIDNSNGSVVKTIQGDIEEGKHLVTWDGKNDAGGSVANGQYTLRISAFDADGSKIASSPYTYGQVESVLTDGGTTLLQLKGGRTVDITDVMAVKGADLNS